MRDYVIASIFLLLGITCIAIQGRLPSDHGLSPYLSNLASALLVGGMISILFKLIQERSAEERLRRLMRIHDSVDDLGLKCIYTESQDYNFTHLIEKSSSLDVVMNDGLRWVGNNATSLVKRFSKNCETVFFTVDPESCFIDCLSGKTCTDKEQLKMKIHDTWKRIQECYEKSEKKGILEIYKLKNYPTRSIFISEKVLIETPYQTASGRTNVPVYEYRKVSRGDSPYHFARKDIAELKKESALVWSCKKAIQNS